MKNRILILNDLLKLQENHVSLNDMITKLQHYGLSYYETISVLNEVTHEPLEKLSDLLLKEEYWQNMKKNSDEKEQTLKSEYEAMMVIKQSKQEHFDQKINETYKSMVETKKEKEKRLKNLDNTLTDIFKS